jgi:hypothetical protein
MPGHTKKARYGHWYACIIAGCDVVKEDAYELSRHWKLARHAHHHTGKYSTKRHVREIDNVVASQLMGTEYAEKHQNRYGTAWTGANTHTAASGVQQSQSAVPSAPQIAPTSAPNPPHPTQGPLGPSNSVATASNDMDIDSEGIDRLSLSTKRSAPQQRRLMNLPTETRLQTIQELI